MKLLSKIQHLSSLVIILMVAGCSQIYDEDKVTCTKEQPVSIIASIDNANVRAGGAPTRTNGNVESDGNSVWTPEEVDSLDFERTINHVFLFVYKIGEDKPHKVFFYHTGTSPLTGIPNLDIRPLNIASGSPTSFTMELELLSGYYNFILLVNSESALRKMKDDKMIEHPEQLVEKNMILTSDNLKGYNRKYLPMVGQHELYVPYHRAGSGTDRLTLIPDIKLERVHACVEFILDTVDKDKPGIFFSPILEETKVTGLTLLNEQNSYTVMPSKKDYTVTGIDSSTPILSTPLPKKPLDPARDTDYTIGIHYQASGYLQKFYNRLLPYVSDYDSQKIYTYVAPATWATNQEECLSVKLGVRFPGDSEDTYYLIPLTNPDVTGDAQFVTRRNTIYRVHAKLKGRDLSVLDYDVIDWTNQDVDIPW